MMGMKLVPKKGWNQASPDIVFQFLSEKQYYSASFLPTIPPISIGQKEIRSFIDDRNR